MDEAKLESLRQLDWEEIAAKVANYARRLGWNLYGWRDGELLPKGQTMEDVVFEVIAEFWDNPDRFVAHCSLTTQLCGVVRQKLWNLSQSKESKTTTREEVSEAVGGREDAKLPDLDLQARDTFRRALDLLAEHPKVKGKSDHESVVTALACGMMDPDELERATGLSRQRIYQVQRELNDIYPAVKRTIEHDGGGSP